MFGSWLISVLIGIGAGLFFFLWNAPVIVARAVLIENKPVPPWLRLLTPAIYFAEGRFSTRLAPGKRASGISTVLALLGVLASISVFNYGVLVSLSIWGDVNFGIGKIVLAEVGFPFFVLLTWVTLTCVLVRYLRKLRPQSAMNVRTT
jgi:hypothetical protein